MRSSSDLAASISLIHCNARMGFFLPPSKPRRKFTIQLWYSVWSSNFPRCISGERWLGIYHATLSTRPDTRGMVSHRLETISVVQTFSFAFPERQGKRLGCNGSSLPILSIPSLLWIHHDAAKCLESLCTSSGTRRASWQSTTLPWIPTSSRVFRCIPDSRLGFLELERRRAWCETWALPKLLVESRSWKIFESSINSNRSCPFRIWSRSKLTVRDSWWCCKEYSFIFCWVTHFLLWTSVLSILQFLGNFLRSIPGEDGSSFPTHYTSVCSHANLDLPIDCLPFICHWDSSSRCDSTNAQSEVLRSKFWIFMSYSVKNNFLWAESLTKTSLLSTSFQVFSEIPFTRIEFSVSVKRMTPSTVPSTFPWLRLRNTDSV